MIQDVILWVICGCFACWEAYAHFIAKNQAAHTLSNRLWALQSKWPFAKWIIRVCLVLLWLHLTTPVLR